MLLVDPVLLWVMVVVDQRGWDLGTGLILTRLEMLFMTAMSVVINICVNFNDTVSIHVTPDVRL